MTLGVIGLALIALGIAAWVAIALRKAGLTLALAGGFAVPALALVVYAILGSPETPDRPLEARVAVEPAVAQAQEQAKFRQMVAGLALRLQNEPDDLQGWTMLARSYRVLDEWPAAVSAYGRVISLKGDAADAADWAELADLHIAAQKGQVDDRALEAAERSLALDPTLAKSRHFVALAAAQRGNYADAANRWRALLADAPSNAVWRRAVADQLAQVEALLARQSAETGQPAPPPLLAAPNRSSDLARPQSGPSAADVAAAREMSAPDRAAFIESMVQRLADRLADQPDDPAGWLRLGRAYGVLGRADASTSALNKAEELASARLASGTGDAAEMQAVLNGVRQLRGQ